MWPVSLPLLGCCEEYGVLWESKGRIILWDYGIYNINVVIKFNSETSRMKLTLSNETDNITFPTQLQLPLYIPEVTNKVCFYMP